MSYDLVGRTASARIILILALLSFLSSLPVVPVVLAQQSAPVYCDPSHEPIPIIEAVNYALDGGFTGENTVTIVAIAWAESSGNPFNCRYNPDSDTWDRGILQLNSFWYRDVRDACAFDPACAFSTVLTSPFSDWIQYRNGEYTEYLHYITSAPLSNGLGDGSLAVTVDRYGTFGSSTAGDDAIYDPVGSMGPSGTTYESSVYFSPLGFFLNIDDGVPGGSIEAGRLTSISRTEARSVFSIIGFDFELTQTLGDRSPQGSTLTQTYKITNDTGSIKSFDLIRHVDGDLYFDRTIMDSGGASSDGLTIFEFDSGDDPTNPSTFVGITNEGGEHIGYVLAPYRFTYDIIWRGAAVLNNSIANDFNGDRIIDSPYDVTLSLGNRFSNIGSGQTVAFVTKTIFGSGSPIARAALPSGVIPAEEHHDNINQGETHWYDFINDFFQDLWVVLGFGSEFNIRVYDPNGSLYREEQSGVSPITITIPNAVPGRWRFEITAITTPYPNDPYVLVVGVRENRSPTAEAGPDQVVAAGGNCLAMVTLNGTGSIDPDRDPLTYAWTGSFGAANGSSPTISLPLGMHAMTLTVNDGKGGVASDTVNVTVVDKTPPNIRILTAAPPALWPPNHRMVPVVLSVSVSDNCDPNPKCKITSVSSNEPENGLGDGDTAPDWGIAGDLTLDLRAERSGKGSGRVYTIDVLCTDPSGNKSTAKVAVNVPHDQGK